MQRTIREIADFVGGDVAGNGATSIKGIASIPFATRDDLVFAEDEKTLQLALASQAGGVLTGMFGATLNHQKPVVFSPHPRLAFARAAGFICPPAKREVGIHPSAVVDPSAHLGKGVTVEAMAVIEERVKVGDNTRIGAGSVIGVGVQIGKDCEIYPNVTIYLGASLGDRVIVHVGCVLGSDGFGYVHDKATGRYEKFPQIGRLEIEDDVEIGANSTVDRGALEVTRIGRGTKIDNLVHVGHNVRIGEDVVIAAQTGFSGSITVEKHAVIGGQVGIGEHATIGEGVMLGGQSGVLPKKVLRGKGIAFWGTPAKPVREYLKELAVLARLARKSDD